MVQRIIKILSLFLFSSSLTSCFAIEILKVYDGDTVLIKNENNKILSLRLKGIDCFETREIKRAYLQAYNNNLKLKEVIKEGKKSKKILKTFIKTNSCNFSYENFGKDKYNRELGVLYCNSININEYMIKNGGCLKYDYFK